MIASNSNQAIEIKSNEIIQLILQYLFQNNFRQSVQCLQQQSQVKLNQISNIKQFVDAFNNKKWNKIITQLSGLMLSQELFFTTYQFIVDSLIESDQYQAAAHIIQQIITPNIKQMAVYRQKIMRMQYIVSHPNQKNLYKNPPTQSRSTNVLQQILSSVNQAQSSRLVQLLTESLKYQVAEGVINPTIKFNLFSGKQFLQQVQEEALIKQIEKTIAYSQQSKITELSLSWTEEYLAIGGVDGLIQLYNTRDYSLYDNQYQREGQMFFHDHPINIIKFNYTDDMLASVDSKALINIWNLKNGKLLRKIDKQTQINAISWGVDPSHILVGYKQKIKLYGIRSCNILKQYNSNSSQYIKQIYCNETRVYSISTVGSLIIFNYSTAEQLFSLQTKQQISACNPLFPDITTHLLNKLMIGFKKKISQIDEYGSEIKSYPVQDGQIQNFISVGQYIYLSIKGSDNKYRYSVIQKQKKKTFFYTSLESNFEHMVMSRKRNLLITYDQNHKLSFWRPTM